MVAVGVPCRGAGLGCCGRVARGVPGPGSDRRSGATPGNGGSSVVSASHASRNGLNLTCNCCSGGGGGGWSYS
jgi:hypothetical protein